MNCKFVIVYKSIINRTLTNNVKLERFNEAMVIYLENLKELNEYLISNNYISMKSSDFPYKLHNDTINNFSIRIDQNNPENWSQCMKYLLTILKMYINYCLKKEDDEYREILEKSATITITK
jgi:hypothetical protein